MALQGDLATFALPDVLRLLSGTTKTGRLAVTGEPHNGEVWFRDGAIAGGSVTSRENAATAPEILYELLRFESGSFQFDEEDLLVDGNDTADVEAALTEAEGLHAEWQEVSAVVPSLDHWVTMAPELATGEITLDGDQWRLLSTLGGGSPVRTVGDQFSEGDLAASKRVKAMADAGLVIVSEPRTEALEDSWTEHRGTEVVADDDVLDLEDVEPASTPEDDLVRLSAEEGPVVLESSEDALLPEPLPGEGTSFSADGEGQVDAPAFQVASPEDELSAVDHALDPAYQPHADTIEPQADLGAPLDDPELAWDALARGTGNDDEIGTSEEAFRAVGWDENPPVDHLDPAKDDDPDRSSLLKFLSSVKP